MAGSTPFESEKKTQSVLQVYMVPLSCLLCRCIWESNDPAQENLSIAGGRGWYWWRTERVKAIVEL